MWTNKVIFYLINYGLSNVFWIYYSLNPQKKPVIKVPFCLWHGFRFCFAVCACTQRIIFLQLLLFLVLHHCKFNQNPSVVTESMIFFLNAHAFWLFRFKNMWELTLTGYLKLILLLSMLIETLEKHKKNQGCTFKCRTYLHNIYFPTELK